MTGWTLYLAIIHLMAFGFIAWVIAWLSWTIHWKRNPPKGDEQEILAAETIVHNPHGLRIVK